MFLRGDRSGSIHPIQTIMLGLLIVMFLGGAELFQLFVTRQQLLEAARSIAAYGASKGRFIVNDPGAAEVINENEAKNSMEAYISSAGPICNRCDSIEYTFYVHGTTLATLTCVNIGPAELDYQIKELSDSGACPGGKYWETEGPSTAVLLKAEVPSILPFWRREGYTIRAFGTASVYTNVPGGSDVFPWIP